MGPTIKPDLNPRCCGKKRTGRRPTRKKKSRFTNIITSNKRIKRIENICVALPVPEYLLITWIKFLIV